MVALERINERVESRSVADIYHVVGDAVRRQREAGGLTREELADRAGISVSFLSYIEAYGKKPSLATIQRLADALGVHVADLFREAPAPGKTASYQLAARFANLIRDQRAVDRERILDVVRTMAKNSRKKR